MLFILTGAIRTGKTTWLQAQVAELAAAGVAVDGVLAPGVWNGDEKVGIENVLLPDGERVLLARPAEQRCPGDLSWEFDANALARVNAHLASLRGKEGRPGRLGLLVIDELGPLELRRGEGLTEAVALLEAGPTPAWPNALIVVRAALVDDAHARLAGSWGSVELLSPNKAGAQRLRDSLL